MVKTAIVKIWSEVVGAVAWDEDSQLGSFEYLPEFARNGWELAPFKMPIADSKESSLFPNIENQEIAKMTLSKVCRVFWPMCCQINTVIA